MANGGRKNGRILNIHWFEGRAASTRWSVREGANAQLRAWGNVKVVFISEISQVMGKAGSGGAEWELGI